MADTTLPALMGTGDHASRPAASAVGTGALYSCTDHGLVYQTDGSSWTTWATMGGDISAHLADASDAHDASAVSILDSGAYFTGTDVEAALQELGAGGGGGGGGTAQQHYDAAAAPGSPTAQDDEFDDGAIDGKWTRVYNSGAAKGTWTERDGGLTWRQTAAGATELDVWAQARTVSVGDYVEAAFSFPATNEPLVGPYIGFSNGTTFGTSNAVGPDVHLRNVDSNEFGYRLMLNAFPGHNSRGTDGTIVDSKQFGIYYLRVKYEAANTWGLYSSQNGIVWRTIQSNYSYTLSPTHVICGVHNFSNPAFSATNPATVRLEYFRVNAA